MMIIINTEEYTSVGVHDISSEDFKRITEGLGLPAKKLDSGVDYTTIIMGKVTIDLFEKGEENEL